MKKTISINISGILFHIEEDGYDTLRKYLDAINKHFSGYKDSKEIISDIENRIAEIFLSNLKNNKQVITAENVDKLIEKMGTIADFNAVEEEVEEPAAESEKDDFYKYVTPPTQDGGGYKKLMRMETKKILGGVCAGIAHYFSIDPLWTRLIAILLLFSGNINFRPDFLDITPFDNFRFSLSFGFFTLIAYIVLWVILPVSYELVEDKNIKKLFRNPDDKVIGGVSSGLSAYFGVEALYVRLAFVILTFAGGSGLLIYLILWIITPVASSITERIKMKGGEITLDSIDSTIKETNQRELALGTHSRSGDQYDVWEAVFSPMGEDGYPKRIFDKHSGTIDKSVAAYWKENYDLAHIIKRDWPKIGEQLKGKIHLYVGDMDNYYLNNAVYTAEDMLKQLKNPSCNCVIDYGDRAEHCWNGDHTQPNYISRLRYHQMFINKWAQEVKTRAPKGVDLKSWLY